MDGQSLTIGPATKSQLMSVLRWLKRDQDESFEGIYCHREIIIQACVDGEMFCAVSARRTVGFVGRGNSCSFQLVTKCCHVIAQKC